MAPKSRLCLAKAENLPLWKGKRVQNAASKGVSSQQVGAECWEHDAAWHGSQKSLNRDRLKQQQQIECHAAMMICVCGRGALNADLPYWEPLKGAVWFRYLLCARWREFLTQLMAREQYLLEQFISSYDTWWIMHLCLFYFVLCSPLS